MCVEKIVVPSGIRMAIGDVAIRLFLTGREVVQKCAVLPVSAMMEDGIVMMGGPMGVDEGDTILQILCLLNTFFVL